jgi:hypothetical protein
MMRMLHAYLKQIPTIKEDTDFFLDELHLREKDLRNLDETISNIKVEIIQIP